jgi:hypothetical protein
LNETTSVKKIVPHVFNSILPDQTSIYRKNWNLITVFFSQSTVLALKVQFLFSRKLVIPPEVAPTMVEITYHVFSQWVNANVKDQSMPVAMIDETCALKKALQKTAKDLFSLTSTILKPGI